MNRYNTLGEFVERHALTLPGWRSHAPMSKNEWRLTTNAPTGQIVGLNAFRGQAIATNGLLVAIESSAGFVRIGHTQWFEVDKTEDDDENIVNAVELRSAKAVKPLVSADEMDEVLEGLLND